LAEAAPVKTAPVVEVAVGKPVLAAKVARVEEPPTGETPVALGDTAVLDPAGTRPTVQRHRRRVGDEGYLRNGNSVRRVGNGGARNLRSSDSGGSGSSNGGSTARATGSSSSRGWSSRSRVMVEGTAVTIPGLVECKSTDTSEVRERGLNLIGEEPQEVMQLITLSVKSDDGQKQLASLLDVHLGTTESQVLMH